MIFVVFRNEMSLTRALVHLYGNAKDLRRIITVFGDDHAVGVR